MAQVTVDVELDEFDDDEIFEYAASIIEKSNSEYKKQRLLRNIKPLIDELSSGGLKIKSLDDKLKIEHLTKVWDKYTSFQLTELLPE